MIEPSLDHAVASALAKADDEAVTCSDAEAVAEGERDVENGRVVSAAELGLGSACDRQRTHNTGRLNELHHRHERFTVNALAL